MSPPKAIAEAAALPNIPKRSELIARAIRDQKMKQKETDKVAKVEAKQQKKIALKKAQQQIDFWNLKQVNIKEYLNKKEKRAQMMERDFILES